MTDRLGTGNNASQMNNHIQDHSNPHLTTASQVGADPLGSASAVQWNLGLHETDLNNPHSTTASQVGADVFGSASAVQWNLDLHEGDSNNPHNTTASQVGADVLGSASAVQWNLSLHTDDHNNPHITTASQVGAVVANSPIVSGTSTKVEYDTKGLVVSGSNATTADINDSLNRRYVTDLDLVTISNTSGCNTGDQVVPVNTSASANIYLTGYNSTTGSFTSASVISTASYVFTASGVFPISVSNGSVISLETTGIVSGSYNAVVVDSFGRVISGSNVYTTSGSFYTGSAIINVAGSIISHLGSGITPGSYTALTVDARGHVISGSNPVLDHTVNITNVGVNTHAQIDSDLLRLVNTTGSNTGDQIVPQNKSQLLNQYFVAYNATTGSFTSASVTSTGSVTFSASGVTPISVSDGYIVSHDDSGVVSGSYNAIQVDAKGHVVSASIISASTIDHNILANLAVGDPHPQYVNVSGDTMTGSLAMGGNSLTNIGRTEYNTAYVKGGEPVGSVYWNSDRETLDITMPNGIVLQQGQELHFFAINQSGVDIPDGSVVMFAGALGASGIIKCQLAITDGTYPATYIMGIATQAIANGSTGKVTFFGELGDFNTSASAAGTILYTNPSVPGGMTSIMPLAPNLKYQIAATVDSKINGHIFVRAIYSMSLHELNDVNISSPTHNQFLVYNSSGSYWYNREGYSGSGPITVSGSVISHGSSGVVSGSYNAVYVDGRGHVTSASVISASTIDHNVLSNLTTGNPHTQYLTTACFASRDELMKDPTGFTDTENTIVTHNSSASTVTLTGNVSAYWRGTQVPELVSGWTSASHIATGTNYLYYDSGSFIWSTTPWSFDKLQIAYFYKGPINSFCVKETHGFIHWETHEVLHQSIGTFRESGGDIGSYLVNSTTAGNRRPTVSAVGLHDEDNITNLPALTSDLYTQFYLSGSSAVPTFVVDATDIVPLLAKNPYYNAFATPNWIQTLVANNSYMCVWLAAVPVSSDAESQAYRYLWIQGQSSGTLASQQALIPANLNLSSLAGLTPEIVFIGKIILRYTGGNWVLTEVSSLTGNKFTQIGTPSGAFLTSVSTGSSLTGDGTSSNPLEVVGFFSGSSTPLYVLASASISGSNSGDQIVPQNKTSTSGQFFVAYNNTTGSFTTGSALTGFSASGVSPINVSGGSIISLNVTGIASGSYNAVTVDSYGRVISGSNLSTGATYTGSAPITVTGSVISLNTTGVTSGSYNQVIVDAWGRVTSASFVSGGGGTTYTGSLPIVVTGSVVSHATSGITSGSYTKVFVDDKGHVTSGTTTHYEILQDDAGAILTDSNGIDILYVEVA